MALVTMMFAGVLLAGCAKQQATRPEAPSTTRTTTPASRSTTPPARASTETSTTNETEPSDRTGIAACDDYLSSYLACHRAAHIFAPDQLQSRYEAMRSSLLRDSKNPDIRPQLAERCNSLARSLRQALHGKPCEASPAPATSSP
jgi:hypothetical protein